MTALGQELYFKAADKLWVSDGTVTKPVALGLAGTQDPQHLVASHGRLFYSASSTYGRELFFYDPNEDAPSPNPKMVKNIRAGTASSDPKYLTAGTNGMVYFQANDGNKGAEFWRSNGTEIGTQLVEDVNDTTTGSGTSTKNSKPEAFVEHKGAIYFLTREGKTKKQELWKHETVLEKVWLETIP